MAPKITVLLCTVRPERGYVHHPEWHTIGKVVEDLRRQTFQDFELLVVDGVSARAMTSKDVGWHGSFSIVSPRSTYWTRNKKVAISAYRNTGLLHARGELIVNLDDCCELPPDYLETFWAAYQAGYCLAARWPEQGDQRSDGPARPGQVYGFGSYPLEAALDINGYDEAFDGSQGLEDVDFSTRLQRHGVEMFLLGLDGFRIHPQSQWDPRAVDLKDPVVRCCNTSWQFTRDLGPRRNTETQWTPGFSSALCGTPCPLLRPREMERPLCAHHGQVCAYLDKGWPHKKPHPLWKAFVEDANNWPVFDLHAERRRLGYA